MSAPAGEPPVPPNQPSNNDRKEESPSSPGQATEQAAAGEDVKMKEAKPEKPEETWDDIPEHVLKVSYRSHEV